MNMFSVLFFRVHPYTFVRHTITSNDNVGHILVAATITKEFMWQISVLSYDQQSNKLIKIPTRMAFFLQHHSHLRTHSPEN